MIFVSERKIQKSPALHIEVLSGNRWELLMNMTGAVAIIMNSSKLVEFKPVRPAI
jgi:hypothetical protein